MTIRDLAPYAAVRGDLNSHLQFYAGLRQEIINLGDADLIDGSFSFEIAKAFLLPKATLAWSPGSGAMSWLPSASFSIGQAFFTQDPRISVAQEQTSRTGSAAFLSPLERSHSTQLVLDKVLSTIDFRVTLGRTTNTQTRVALVRSFFDRQLELGANGMIAKGYTGQTTETFNRSWRLGVTPYCAPGTGPSGAPNDFACGANEQAVGVRMVSWVSGSISW